MTTIQQDPSTALPAGRLRGWDCVELWVGNARTTAGFLMSAFGFHCTAYAGPETGMREKAATSSSRATSGSW
jgi:4-hydroxyphenylpyruvate dioxygenase